MPQLELRFLGPVHIEVNGTPLKIVRSKAKALLSYLTVTGDDQSRDGLLALLWSDVDQRRAQAALRNALWELNKSPVGDWLEIDTETVCFNRTAQVWLDVTLFQQLLARCQSHDHPPNEACPDCLAPLTEAVELYRGDFLSGFTLPDAPGFDEWHFFQTESLRQQLASALEGLISSHSAEGDYEAALSHARRRLALDPLHEAAHRQLMLLYAQSKQQAAALRQYEVCVDALETELGLAPQPETTTLYEQIRSGQVSKEANELGQRGMDIIVKCDTSEQSSISGEEAAQPEARSDRSAPHNLPIPPTPFIGRETELAELVTLLANPNTRLITIFGPGGIGKTRLALEAARAQLPNYQHGVYFVPLVPLSNTETIIPAIAEAVDYPFQSDSRSPQQQLFDYVREKHLLLILDNIEHLLGLSPKYGLDTAEFITALLQSAPQVKVLVTSRKRLQLHQEQLYPLHGLAVPTPDTSAAITSYAAVELFLQSARRVQPNFEVRPADASQLTNICRLVGGMPLGLELAAAWVDMLSLADIVTELQQSLDFLETEMRDIPRRHRNMRAVFDASWQQLREREQAILPQLSVFRGGFTREAAQAITGASLRELRGLANKSLLHHSPANRYVIHELLRQYAAEQLHRTGKPLAQSSAVSAVHDRHAAYYCAFLNHCEADLKGPRQQTALAEIEAEEENIRTAWQWAVAHGQVEQLNQALFSLGLFLLWRGRLVEGEEMVRAAAEQVTVGLTTAASRQPQTVTWSVADQTLCQVRILTWQSIFERRLRRYELAQGLLQQGLALLARPVLVDRDTRAEQAHLLLQQGQVVHYGDSQESIRIYEQSLAIYRALDEPWGMAHVLEALGLANRSIGQPEKARRIQLECLALRQKIEDVRGIASILSALALTFRHLGQVDRAEAFARQSLVICRELDDRVRVAYALFILGSGLCWSGKFADSLSPLQESLAIYQELNLLFDQGGMAGEILGWAFIHLGRYSEARARLQNSVSFYGKMDNKRSLVFSLNDLGCVALAEGAHSEAQHVLEKSLAIGRRLAEPFLIGGSLGLLGIAKLKLNHPRQAQKYLTESLQIVYELRTPLAEALPGVALLLANQGASERSVELYALALLHPYMANSCWFEDVVGQHIKTAAAALLPEVITAAEARGRSRDLWQTVEELLVELQVEGAQEDKETKGSSL